jgi:GNAT acetyltransferase-like protein
LNIQIINPIENPNWDELILTNNQSTFFHTAAWAKVLYESYNYKPLYFTLIEDSKLSALVPIMEIKSYLIRSRGVSLPFSDQCSLIVKNTNAFDEIFKEIIKYGKKTNWRIIYLKGNVKFLEGTIFPFVTFLTHDLDLSKTEQEIFSTFRDSTKRNIKKAVKNGVHVNIRNTLESVKEYYRLNCITRKSHGLPPQPYHFFEKIYEHIVSKKKGFVTLAIHQNRVISGAVFFHFGRQAIFKYGASNRNYLNLRPNNLVMWEAIKWHCRNGFKTFDFGRTEPENKGLLQFKRGWGVKEDILNYYKYDLLKDCFVSKKAGLKTSYGFFKIMPEPILRLIGNILYRHVG